MFSHLAVVNCVISTGKICLSKFCSGEILLFACGNNNSKISPLRSFLATVEMTQLIIAILYKSTFIVKIQR
jgi:hypothetical protein